MEKISDVEIHQRQTDNRTDELQHMAIFPHIKGVQPVLGDVPYAYKNGKLKTRPVLTGYRLDENNPGYKRLLADYALDVQKRKEKQELRDLASHDSLTHLLNHGTFAQRLGEESRRESKNRNKIAVIMLDLDDFKICNDLYGHAFGDQVLVAIAQLMNETFRANDLKARYGGEEFALGLLQTRRKRGQKSSANEIDRTFIDRVRQFQEKLRKLKHRNADGEVVNVNASIGMYIVKPGEGINAKEVLRRADLALDYSKKDGKNCAHLYKMPNDNGESIDFDRIS